MLRTDKPSIVRARQELLDGFKHHEAGELEKAAALYRKALRALPDHPDLLHLSGVICATRGEHGKAVTMIKRALTINPDFAAAYSNLGISLAALGQFNEAIQSYHRAIALRPQFDMAYNNLGQALTRQGDIPSAIDACRKALQINPASVCAMLSLGCALTRMGRHGDAEPVYRQALQLQPNHVAALSDLGKVLMELDRSAEAMQFHRRAVELAPQSAAAVEAMGLAQYRMCQLDQAEENFRRAVALDPKFALGWNSLGWAVRARGNFDEAVICFRRALEIDPAMVDAHRSLALTPSSGGNTSPGNSSPGGTQSPDGAGGDIDRLEQLLRQPRITPNERILAAFALGKRLDDADRFEQAFAQYAAANALYREHRAAAGMRFDIHHFTRHVDAMIESSMLSAEQDVAASDPSELPVFVVGMPRSGTSLVEQIAASHPRVFGGGERKEIAQLLARLDKTNDPRARADLVQKYLADLAALGGGAQRVIDKLPDNILHVARIARLFPRSRVILCSRDARDTCLSCFFQLFTEGNLFAYDLRDCGRRHVQTLRLADHWLRTAPLRILQIHYESLVENPEPNCRRLIDFLGLDWDPACLEFDKTQRVLMTASAWQVRQPMYTRSIGRWRRYERFLGPLLEELNGPAKDA